MQDFDAQEILCENGNLAMQDTDLQTVETAVAALVRRRVADDNDRLCCNDVNNLTVVDVDSYGFVTLVKCTRCGNDTETTCHDLNWTYEKISKLSQLKMGDHICWHRPLAYWHHAIVTNVSHDKLTMQIIHYSGNVKVEETEKSEAEACKGWCNTLYRVNYHDCYNNEYTVVRARKLVNKERYNLAERNCEHFSRWCKTGLTSSSQISIAWISAAKGLLMIGLKMAMLLVLGLLQCSYESQEENVKDRPYLEKAQNIFLAVYIAFTTVVFIAYLLKTTGSHLVTVRPRGRRDDAENPCCCDCYKPGTDSSKAIRGTFCLCCTCCSIIRRIVCCFCDNVKCGPCTCCRRPARLACRLFIRIVVRELLAATCTLIAIWLEEVITNARGIREQIPLYRTGYLLLAATIAHLVGYLLGACLGRWFEACYCCFCCCCCCCE